MTHLTIVASNASTKFKTSKCCCCRSLPFFIVVGDLLENDWVCTAKSSMHNTNRFLRPQVIGNNHRKCNVLRGPLYPIFMDCEEGIIIIVHLFQCIYSNSLIVLWWFLKNATTTICTEVTFFLPDIIDRASCIIADVKSF